MERSALEPGGTGWQSDLFPRLDQGPQSGPPPRVAPTDTVLPAGVSGIGHRASGIGHRASGIGHRASKQRFVVAVSIGVAVVAIPYLWVLSDLWTRSPSLFRVGCGFGHREHR